MLIAIVDFTVAAKDRAAALTALQREAPGVRRMSGNLAYGAYVDPQDAEAVRIIHEWQDVASFEAYASSDAFRASGAVLRPLMTSTPISRRLTADLLETVR